MNVNIPQLADSLFERTTNTSWVVVFKSLITTHHLMVYGNEVRHLILFPLRSKTINWFHFNGRIFKCLFHQLVVLSLTVVTPPAAFCPVFGFKEYTFQPQ